MGYRVHWGIFSAEETGAIHKRERVFIMAIRKDTLEYANSERLRDEQKGCEQINNDEKWNLEVSSQEREAEQRRTIKSSESNIELANAKKQFCEQSWNSWKWRSRSSNSSYNELGNTNNSRLQRWIGQICKKCSHQWTSRSNGPFDREHVARPGQPQQAWEHPRVISRKVESIVGLSVNGYNFREDFLRALGNSVYADTAELAFRTLIKKFK